MWSWDFWTKTTVGIWKTSCMQSLPGMQQNISFRTPSLPPNYIHSNPARPVSVERNTKISRNAVGMEVCTCEKSLEEAAKQGLQEQPVLITKDIIPMTQHPGGSRRNAVFMAWPQGLYPIQQQHRRLVSGKSWTHMAASLQLLSVPFLIPITIAEKKVYSFSNDKPVVWTCEAFP